MSLRERGYRVLLASVSDKLNAALVSLLTGAQVQVVASVAAARRAWGQRSYDFIIINAPLPDSPGVGFAIDAAQTHGAVVLLLVRGEGYGEVFDRVAEHGVFTLSKPVSRSALGAAVDWMTSARELLRSLERKTLSVEEKMEEIRLVNRAKWILMTRRHMSEDEAHRAIGKAAMDRCVSRRTVAKEIIRDDEGTKGE